MFSLFYLFGKILIHSDFLSLESIGRTMNVIYVITQIIIYYSGLSIHGHRTTLDKS